MIIGFLQICFPIFPCLFLLFVDGDSLKSLHRQAWLLHLWGTIWGLSNWGWLVWKASFLSYIQLPGHMVIWNRRLCWQEWMMQPNGLYIGVFLHMTFFGASRNSRVKSSRLSEWRNCHSQEASLTSKTCFATKFWCWVIGFWSSRHVSRVRSRG